MMGNFFPDSEVDDDLPFITATVECRCQAQKPCSISPVWTFQVDIKEPSVYFL
jgi:hypothetical protein